MGIRSWMVAMSSFGGQVAMAHVASRVPFSSCFMDQMPAKPKGRLELSRMNNGVLLRRSFLSP
jgi:hypothetical protein